MPGPKGEGKLQVNWLVAPLKEWDVPAGSLPNETKDMSAGRISVTAAPLTEPPMTVTPMA